MQGLEDPQLIFQVIPEGLSGRKFAPPSAGMRVQYLPRRGRFNVASSFVSGTSASGDSGNSSSGHMLPLKLRHLLKPAQPDCPGELPARIPAKVPQLYMHRCQRVRALAALSRLSVCNTPHSTQLIYLASVKISAFTDSSPCTREALHAGPSYQCPVLLVLLYATAAVHEVAVR